MQCGICQGQRIRQHVVHINPPSSGFFVVCGSSSAFNPRRIAAPPAPVPPYPHGIIPPFSIVQTSNAACITCVGPSSGRSAESQHSARYCCSRLRPSHRRRSNMRVSMHCSLLSALPLRPSRIQTSRLPLIARTTTGSRTCKPAPIATSSRTRPRRPQRHPAQTSCKPPVNRSRPRLPPTRHSAHDCAPHNPVPRPPLSDL